jgi:hypothetical protein
MRSLLLKPTNALRGRKNHKMTQFDNDKAIMELCEQLVDTIRSQEKAKLRASLYEAWNSQQPKPVKRRFHADSSLGRLYRVLARRKYGVNIRTLVRESGLSERGVQNAVHRLRQQGYNIQCNRAGYLRPKYRLAS